MLDLVQAADKALFEAMLSKADVFVQNLAPGASARMGLSAAALRARDERLIVCDVSGYAPDGPMGHRRAYDLLIQCETGVLSVTGAAKRSCSLRIPRGSARPPSSRPW